MFLLNGLVKGPHTDVKVKCRASSQIQTHDLLTTRHEVYFCAITFSSQAHEALSIQLGFFVVSYGAKS